MSDAIVNVNDANFDSEVLKANQPVLVDFWAEWCGPCRMIAPILHEIAEENKTKIKIVKINVDEAQSIPAQFGVRGIPTLMIFKNGSAHATKVGALSKAQLQNFIDENI